MTKPETCGTYPTDKIHWPSLFAAIAAISAVGVAIGLGLPLLSMILEKRGISSTMIGVNSAMAGVASMLAAPLTSRLAHDCGVARTMIIAVFISAISALGFYFADAFWMWFPLRIVFHGATTTLFILSEFWINATAPPSKRGMVLGMYATGLAVGFAAGPLLFSLVGSDGITPFVTGAGVILLAVIPIFLARKESPRLDEKPNHHFARYIWLVPMASAAAFVFGSVQAGGLSLFPIYATREGFNESQAALLLTVMGVGNMAFQIPIGLLSDRLKDRRLLLGLMALLGFVGTLTLPFLVQSWALLASMLLLWGGCVSGMYTVGLTHLGSRLTGSDLVSANAAFIFCYAIGTISGPQIVGVSMDLNGTNGFAWALAAFFAFYVVLSIARLVLKSKQA
ncbi:MFS transporter [Rhizobium sp. CG4]|jgi:predicted MFS family arabinose efflux permease|uniref:MFS transporter n=1 Tax=Rhizobium sp. CG4 TaxID=2726075 RepID=UPI002033AC27|nr:MFS transporter [Rhizobium sp. CG4]MCM2455214.1 MFS transporter [Rhizobium sp. CG4]